ncbi:hypothetical protein AVEN_267876-1 [Araneus ventricosus]|uniref:Uncharacterized protein n=1 Tax=Araneus ventricosus TaxID=182803 RepID=A0A4Y2HAF1_ARAVE|nr:hypothetical protein AVEN_267876-1 [Araneus ventricosus]
MAREKMFDPAFQKAFSEAIEKQNKIFQKRHLGGICGPPHTAKVNWNDDDLSDESEEENCDSCGKSLTPDDKSSADREEQKVEKDAKYQDYIKDQDHHVRRDSHQEASVRYIFPVCNYCDFAWRFDSRKKLFCPEHGAPGRSFPICYRSQYPPYQNRY